MYAVLQTGGKQYQVREGDLVQVEKLKAEIGEHVIFENVLLCKADNEKPQIGQPFVKNLCVEAEVLDHDKAKKIFVFTFKRRKGSHKQMGHRQPFTCLKILRIGSPKA